jgi:DNA-binding protein HU-beta
MNKTELITAISNSANLTKANAAAALDAALNAIMDEVAAGNKVTLPGFGTFEKRHREARSGRNPQNGATVEIPASDAPAFKAGKGFKLKVNPPAPVKAKKQTKKKTTKK